MSSKTQATNIPSNKHLTANAGIGGLVVWLKALARASLIFGASGRELITGISEAPIPPHENDTQPPISQRPTNPDDDENLSDISYPKSHTLPSTPTHTPIWIYQHTKNGQQLTAQGYKDFRTAVAAHNALPATREYPNNQLEVINWSFNQMNQTAIDLIEGHPLFPGILAQPNVVTYHHLLHLTFANSTTNRSTQALINLQQIRQGNSSMTEYAQTLRHVIAELTATFQDPDKPGYIKIADFHKTTLVANIAPKYQPFIHHLTASDQSIRALSVTDLETKLRAVEVSHELYAQQSTSHSHPKTTHPHNPKTTPAPPDLYSTDTNNALFTHSTSRGDRNQPHCPKCAQHVGKIYNNHGFEGAPPCTRIFTSSTTNPPNLDRQTALITSLLAAINASSPEFASDHHDLAHQAQQLALGTILASDDDYIIDAAALSQLDSSLYHTST